MTKTARALARGTAASVRQKSTRTSSGNRQSGRTSKPPAEPKRKGGPAPGTPSPVRTRMTPELQAHVKRRYEETGEPVCQIALDVGVDESVIRRMGRREGWVRYVAPPRDLPPIATLLAQVEELVQSSADPMTPTPDPSPHSSPDGERPLAYGGGEKQGNAATREDNIARFTQVVMAHLDEFEAVRRAGKLIARQHLPTARAISILTDAFNTLQRLRAALPGTNPDDFAATDMPADLDAFREELAQRIEKFIASRTDAGAFAEPAAAPAEATE